MSVENTGKTNQKAEQIRRSFSAFAPDYDSHMRHTNHLNAQEKLIQQLYADFDFPYLDVCTGTGALPILLSKYRQLTDLSLLDSSKEMIDLAVSQLSNKAEKLNCYLCDLNQLPHFSEKYKTISVSFGFSWVDDPSRVIDAIHDRLELGGNFIAFEEEHFPGVSTKPVFSTLSEELQKLAALETYVSSSDLKKLVIGTKKFVLDKELDAQIDSNHKLVALIFRKVV